MNAPFLPTAVVPLLAEHVAKQRWYAASGGPGQAEMRVVDSRLVASTSEDSHHLWWVMVEAGGSRYQLLIGERAAGALAAGALAAGERAARELADHLDRHPEAMVGCSGSASFYDATYDAELMLAFFQIVTGTTASHVRPVGAEQSNTSLVFDDRVIVKIYRRLLEGTNPDIEVTSALVAVGFTHVAEPAGTWRADGADLAFAQRFLAGGTDGWALALTSLRKLFPSPVDDPAESGADFSPEAFRLGRMTAEMHVALARALPAEPGGLMAGWSAFAEEMGERLRSALAAGGSSRERSRALESFVAAVSALRHVGAALRVHGDYHLGQVMRTDGGWFVLDFEGEPARPFEERARPSSVMKDVTGMLRSLDYAARFALRELDQPDDERNVALADAWERHNREAFLDGYMGSAGVDELLAAAAEDRALVMAAFEMDKALYELRYERAYRPGWVDIPTAAIGRIVDRLG